MRLRSGLLLGALLTAASPSNSWAQAGAPFYKDKTIRIVLSAGVAGGYMEYARTLAPIKAFASPPEVVEAAREALGGR